MLFYGLLLLLLLLLFCISMYVMDITHGIAIFNLSIVRIVIPSPFIVFTTVVYYGCIHSVLYDDDDGDVKSIVFFFFYFEVI